MLQEGDKKQVLRVVNGKHAVSIVDRCRSAAPSRQLLKMVPFALLSLLFLFGEARADDPTYLCTCGD